jgi:hypothetical protein
MLGKTARSYLKTNKSKKGVAQVTEQITSKYEAPSSNPSTSKEKKRKRKNMCHGKLYTK